MKRILCPVDFSETSENAVEYAVRIAQKMRAGITLLNVQVLADLTVQEVFLKKDSTMQSNKERLAAWSETISATFHIPCGFDSEQSNFSLSKLIGEKAFGYDLIVMGTEGTQSIGQLLFGTNTYKVIRETNIPVLLVPGQCRFREVKKIVFAFDYWRAHQIPLTNLMAFAGLFKSKVVILQALEESKSEKVEAELKDDQKLIRQFYGNEGTEIQFDTIHVTDLAPGINRYMTSNLGDMLVLSAVAHPLLEKIFHKSVIKDIAGMASYPVYIFQ